MNKSLLLLAALAANLNASTLLNDNFDSYPDGPLVGNVGSAWAAHSTGTRLVTVTNGQARLVGASSAEDVNLALAGGPYTPASNVVCYSSFTINFVSVPSAAGSYFAHYKDSSSTYRGKVFASLTNLVGASNAAAGTFFLGVANQANAVSVQLPAVLQTNVTYTVVTRYAVASGQTTLWLNPTAETDASVTASDTVTTATAAAYALRQDSGTGGTLWLDNLKVGTAFSDVAGANTPPFISSVLDQSIPANTNTGPVSFNVSDSETTPGDLVVIAVSSNLVLVPNANIQLGGSGAARTVTVTPAANQQGVAVISLTVSDGSFSASTSFRVTVGQPSISPVATQEATTNQTIGPVSFTVSDTETLASNLTVTASSSDPAVVPNGNLILGGSGTNRTVTVIPVPNKGGTAVITLKVSDGTMTNSTQFLAVFYTQLGLLRTDDFNRADGPLLQFDGNWLSNGGSGGTNAQQMQIVGQKLLVSEAFTEDCGTELPPDLVNYNPGPFYTTNSGVILYAGMSVKFLGLPSSSGSYFAHFSDGGTINFRGRIFASTANAASGFFRLGVANRSSSITAADQVPLDLATNFTYNIILRYNTATGASTLWVNPTNETTGSVTATDVPSPVDIQHFVFRQNTGIGVLQVDDLKVGGSWSSVYQAPDWPPTISDITDQLTSYGTPTAAIPFTVGDLETAAGSLTLSAASTNTALLPTNRIVFDGSGTDRTVTLSPAAGQSGTTLVTVTVRDVSGQTASDSFVLTVLAGNNPPLISSIPSQSVPTDTPTAALPFTIFDYETAADSLTVWGASTNVALVPNANIVFGGSGSNRTVTVTPTTSQIGGSDITVFVTDGTFTNSTTFHLTVNIILLLADSFSYPDGPVTTNSGFLWKAHSGTTGQTQVASGKLMLSAPSQSEDINAVLTNAPFTPASGAVLYAGFTVNFSALPVSQYFAHFSQNSSTFAAKVFATTSNAAPGFFRLGIANNVSTLGVTNPPYPLDLTNNTPVRVIIRYAVGTGLATLWLNPTVETDTSITATDVPAPITVTNFAFRQANTIGSLSVDDLLVGTTFATVLGEAVTRPSLQITRDGGAFVVSWPANYTGFALETSTNIADTNWTSLGISFPTDNGRFVSTNQAPVGNLYYRLKK